ncbi:MAG TPA: hypothetical protein DGT23_24005 [Micromonosporaceae bacterium]|nr:hypothetical protein [Micromonosporaceae bacterium]
MTIGLVPVATLAVAAIQAQSWLGGAQAAGVLLVAVGIPLGITATTDDPADSTKSPSTSEQETRLVAAGDHLQP